MEFNGFDQNLVYKNGTNNLVKDLMKLRKSFIPVLCSSAPRSSLSRLAGQLIMLSWS